MEDSSRPGPARLTNTADRAPAVARRHRPQLSEEAASYLRELIMSGQLSSGDYVRVDEAAAELGMSVTPVREGLVALRAEGFVLLEPRRGFVVAPLSRQDILDVFRGQALIAGELAARACDFVDAAKLDELRRLQDELRDATVDAEVERLNHAFHRSVNLTARAPKLSWLLAASVHYVPARFFGSIPGWREASTLDHASILNSLVHRDRDAARSAMTLHIEHAGVLLADHIRPGESAATPATLEPESTGA